MPLVDLDPSGSLSDSVPVEFTDGPLQGNTQWIVEWLALDLRQVFQVQQAGQQYLYKTVEINDNVNVFADYVGPG